MRVTTPSGVLIDESLVKVFDTAALDWEEEVADDGTPLRTFRKTLSRDADGDSALCVRWYLPEAFVPGREFRHGARSFGLCLGGELTYWEGERDRLVTVKEGCWIDRRPGSRYGWSDTRTPTGLLMLEWRTATEEPFLPISAADTMTFDVPYAKRTKSTYPGLPLEKPLEGGQPAGAVVVDSPGVSVLNTRAMRWQPHPTIGGHYLKPLSFNDDGEPILVLWYFPPGVASTSLPFRGYHTYREWAYIVEGELRHWEYGDPASDVGDLITFRQGLFLDRLAHSVHGVEDEISSRTGCMILFMRALDPGFVGDRAWRVDHTEVLA